jgi:hypothetical protein
VAHLARVGMDALGLAEDSAAAEAAAAEAAAAADRTRPPRVIAASLETWLCDEARDLPPWDLIVTRAPAGGTLQVDATKEDSRPALRREADRPALEQVVPLVAPSGCLLVLIEAEGRAGDDPAQEQDIQQLRSRLADLGLQHQRSYVAYPDARSPSVIISRRLLRVPYGDAMVRTFARAQGAGTVIVAAARDASALHAFTRPGSAWAPPPEARLPGWASTLELTDESGTWKLESLPPLASATSGPLISSSISAPVSVGENGEDVLVQALLEWGVSGRRAQPTLQAWRIAAQEVLHGAADARHEIDVSPRSFTVTEHGEWRHVPRELSMRFPVPPEVVTFGALVGLLVERVAQAGPLPGLRSDASVADAARAILAAIGLEVADETATLWVGLTTDIAMRTERPAPSQADRSRELFEVLAGPLWKMPQVALGFHEATVARLVERVAEIDRLEESLATRTAEVDRLEESLAMRTAEVDRLEESLAMRTAEVDRVSRDLERTGPEITDLRAEADRLAGIAAGREAQLASHAAAMEGLRAQAEGLRREIARLERGAGASDAELDRSRKEEEALRDELRLERAWAVRRRPPIALAALRSAALRIREGAAREDAERSGLFDREWYLERYPDVARTGLDPVIHYLRRGAREGRDPGPGFDTRAYLVRYPDVARGGQNPLMHFIRHGRSEGRLPGRSSRGGDEAA